MNPIRFTKRLSDALQRRATPILAASRAGHKSAFKQVCDIAALSWGPTHLSSLEYLTMGLYNQQVHPNPEGALFGGVWFKE